MLAKALLSLFAIAATAMAAPSSGKTPGRKVIHPIRHNGAILASTLPISYHGGPIMSGTVNTYIIYYGSWSTNQKSIINAFTTGIGATTWFNIEKTYHDNSGHTCSGPVNLGGTVVDNYSQGKSLSDNSLPSIVSHAIANGLPTDPNGVYMLVTSGDVSETSGFCTQYCGFHTSGTINGANLTYAFSGDATSCTSACIAPENQSSSPNGDIGVDGLISVYAHELVETISDPYGNAWYDVQGQENADKCAWTFGTESTASNGSKYNIAFGGRQYLIQRNWDAATQKCQQTA
ncbi:hypothetical protein BZG36_02656 [Bifiguratus adelaidae]|uniref:WSC domain-containing protein n=1 Tax=Bifiguratus adelaidae TaxID=1938954 RepID=A0A261Y2Y4_9FUNG|nr:hypothetical protein BZG36_02656 [Bifiguratus adelaidae]